LSLLNLLILFVSFISLVLSDAVLDVLSLLLFLELFVFVVDNIGHFVHHRLDASSSISDCFFPLFLLLVCNLLHLFNVLVFLFLSLFFIKQAFLFLFLVFTDDFHCSLSLLHLLLKFAIFF
jgi:hypothetical protein